MNNDNDNNCSKNSFIVINKYDKTNNSNGSSNMKNGMIYCHIISSNKGNSNRTLHIAK